MITQKIAFPSDIERQTTEQNMRTNKINNLAQHATQQSHILSHTPILSKQANTKKQKREPV